VVADEQVISIVCLRAGKEGSQHVGRLGRRLLGEEMPTFHRVPANVIGPVPPEREWAGLSLIPGVERSVRAPRREQRTADAAADCDIGLVVHVTPRQMCLRKAVEKQNRRAGAGPSHKTPRFRGVDYFAREGMTQCLLCPAGREGSIRQPRR
jgi:hypothetical protein